MGNRQRTKSIFFRANWLVVLLVSVSNLSFSQSAKLSMFLQNGFYYETPKWEEEKQIIIEANSKSDCDSLVGALKTEYLRVTKTDTITQKWKLYSYLSFDYEDGSYSITKVQKMKDTLILGYQVFSFFKKDKCWIHEENQYLANIQFAIQALKPDAFWVFYNSEPSEIPEIDAIKAKYKTPEGILDIDKLGAYLKTKPATRRLHLQVSVRRVALG